MVKFFALFICLFVVLKSSQASTVYEKSTLGDDIIVTLGKGSSTCNLSDLPLRIEVTLSGLRPPNSRTNFNRGSHEDRMKAMNRKQDDEKGHLLASVYGGPAEVWNLAPQAHAQNNYDGEKSLRLFGNWKDSERKIEDYLRKGQGKVHYVTNIFYTDNDICRPNSFQILATFLDKNGGQVGETLDSGKLSNYRLPRLP